MPITRSGLLTDADAVAARSVIDILTEHGTTARELLDPNLCSTGNCAAAHSSAQHLQEFYDRAAAGGVLDQVRATAS